MIVVYTAGSLQRGNNIMYFVYMLECRINSRPKGKVYIYTGYTNNLQRRLKEHQEGKGARYTKRFDNIKLVYSENFETRSQAMRREKEIKKLNRKEKKFLIKMAITV